MSWQASTPLLEAGVIQSHGLARIAPAPESFLHNSLLRTAPSSSLHPPQLTALPPARRATRRIASSRLTGTDCPLLHRDWGRRLHTPARPAPPWGPQGQRLLATHCPGAHSRGNPAPPGTPGPPTTAGAPQEEGDRSVRGRVVATACAQRAVLSQSPRGGGGGDAGQGTLFPLLRGAEDTFHLPRGGAPRRRAAAAGRGPRAGNVI